MNDNLTSLSRSSALEPVVMADSGILLREAQVLGPGLAQGLKQGVSQSLDDLRGFGTRFGEDPGKAVSEFVADHWSEAAVGAAITFLSPRKWANVALAAASMQGVVRATGETALMTAFSGADPKSLTDNYAARIAEETHMMVNGLPMALAGGYAGKLGANALFGKGMGAWDLAAGQVKLRDVKANLYHIKDQIAPPAVKVVVADLDNTLVSTRKYLALGIQDGIKEVSLRTGLPEAELYHTLGRQMEASKAHTYPWTLEMALAEPLGVGKPGGMTMEQFKATVTEPFWQAMDKSLKQNLNLYEGVAPTLQALKEKGIPVVVLSNSTASSGLRRFNGGGLSEGGLVERFYTLPNYKEPVGLAAELLESGRARMNDILAQRTPLQRVLPPTAEKPSTLGMEQIMRQYRVRPEQIFFIGDNLKKDMGLAEKTGVRGFRAEYSDVDLAYGPILDRLKEGIPKPAKAATPTPKYEGDIKAFPEVLNHLRPKANYGDAASSALRSLAVTPAWYLPLQAYGLKLPELEE